MSAFDQVVDPVYRGDPATLNFTCNPVVDLTGVTVQFTLAKAENTKTKLLQKNGTVTDGPAGKFSVSLDATETDRAPATYVFDAWRMDSTPRIVAKGTLVIHADVRLPL
jgi:hypothetical protein